MPNTNPPIDDESVIRFIQAKARQAMDGLVDVHPIGAVDQGERGNIWPRSPNSPRRARLAFSDDGEPVFDAELMRRALEYSAMFYRPVIQHAQDPAMTKGGGDE